jgi:hypothetical protein
MEPKYDTLEPAVRKYAIQVEDSLYSIALSLKRIADTLESTTTKDETE